MLNINSLPALKKKTNSIYTHTHFQTKIFKKNIISWKVQAPPIFGQPPGEVYASL